MIGFGLGGMVSDLVLMSFGFDGFGFGFRFKFGLTIRDIGGGTGSRMGKTGGSGSDEMMSKQSFILLIITITTAIKTLHSVTTLTQFKTASITLKLSDRWSRGCQTKHHERWW